MSYSGLRADHAAWSQPLTPIRKNEPTADLALRTGTNAVRKRPDPTRFWNLGLCHGKFTRAIQYTTNMHVL